MTGCLSQKSQVIHFFESPFNSPFFFCDCFGEYQNKHALSTIEKSDLKQHIAFSQLICFTNTDIFYSTSVTVMTIEHVISVTSNCIALSLFCGGLNIKICAPYVHLQIGTKGLAHLVLRERQYRG